MPDPQTLGGFYDDPRGSMRTVLSGLVQEPTDPALALPMDQRPARMGAATSLQDKLQSLLTEYGWNPDVQTADTQPLMRLLGGVRDLTGSRAGQTAMAAMPLLHGAFSKLRPLAQMLREAQKTGDPDVFNRVYAQVQQLVAQHEMEQAGPTPTATTPQAKFTEALGQDDAARAIMEAFDASEYTKEARPDLFKATPRLIPEHNPLIAPRGFEIPYETRAIMDRNPDLSRRWQQQDMQRWLDTARHLEGPRRVGTTTPAKEANYQIKKAGPDRLAAMKEMTPTQQELYRLVLRAQDESYRLPLLSPRERAASVKARGPLAVANLYDNDFVNELLNKPDRAVLKKAEMRTYNKNPPSVRVPPEPDPEYYISQASIDRILGKKP